MSALRRYEILLPSQFNDGRPIPQELIADTLHELEQQFGAASCETQMILGLWRREGELYRDSLARVFVDAEDGSIQFWTEEYADQKAKVRRERKQPVGALN